MRKWCRSSLVLSVLMALAITQTLAVQLPDSRIVGLRLTSSAEYLRLTIYNSLPNRSLSAVEEGYISTDDGVRLFYRKVGSGRSVVVIPLGFIVFDDFKRFARGRTLIFYDMRGRGRSDAVADGNKLGIQHDVADVERIRRHFRLNKFSLIGYSYLGLMSVMYAMEYPQHVERIVQLGPVPLKFGTEYPVHLTANDEEPVVDPAGLAKLDALKKEKHDVSNPKDYCEAEWQVFRVQLVGNPVNVEKLGKSKCDLPNEWPVNLRRHFQYSFGSVKRLDILKERVSKVSVPVLTIHGTKDRNASYGGGREWAVMLPNARLLTVAGAAHQSWADFPELVFPAIETFLKGAWPKTAEKITAVDTKTAHGNPDGE